MPRIYESESKKLTRSRKLRKYASVYKSYVRKKEQSVNNKSTRRIRRRETDRNKDEKIKDKTRRKTTKKHMNDKKKPVENTPKRKTLNAYQKFVQIESKKNKYRSIPGKERMSIIAAEWKKICK